MKPDRWLLIEEVARIARTTPSTVRHWLRDRRLASIKPGRRRLVSTAELERFLFAGRRP